MSTITRLGLVKPDPTDFYNLAVQNANTDIIDAGLVLWGGTTTNTANAYSIATPDISALVEGMAVSFKCNADSSGAATLNWDGKGAKPILKANGTAVTNLKSGGIYTVRYGGVNFILQGEGASGNATASDLLTGKTATTDAGEITGTMPNRAGDNAALASSVSGTTLKLRPPSGFYDGVDDNVTIIDADFIAANIRSGKDIFGLLGTLVEGMKYAKGTVSALSQYNMKFLGFNVTGLGFRPSLIVIYRDYSGGLNYYSGFQSSQFQLMGLEWDATANDGLNLVYGWSDMNPPTRDRPVKRTTPDSTWGYPAITADGFYANVVNYNNDPSQATLDAIKSQVASNPIKWIAFEKAYIGA